MQEQVYGPPGGVSRRGATPGVPTYRPASWVTGHRAAQPPNDQPQPDAHKPGALSSSEGWGDYDPSSPPQDPAFEDFTVVDDGDGGGDGYQDAAPVPPNVIGGEVGEVAAEFTDYSSDDFGEIPPNIRV